MRLVSVNVNGIRAAARRGGLDWLVAQDADVITLQEVRATDEQLLKTLADGGLGDWHVASAPGRTKGHAGVAVLTRQQPTRASSDIGPVEFTDAGRWIEVDVPTHDGPVTVISTYVHTGEAATPKQDEKFRFLDAVGSRLETLAENNAYVVLTGDLNICHSADDLKNWKGNIGKAGFLPEEQAHLDRWIRDHGYVDVHRHLQGPGPGPYTWWSWRGKAFDNDAGWRIDYQFASSALAKFAVRAEVGRAVAYAERWSDHAAVTVDYDLTLG
ncbi:exodeoxyribonuclease III [Knoellia sinensis KCTC 19936]|uniref:Exodeoxyribonuclease III n=1 Tax=Knoellia sinensis KCTC 19936 TaxID=1385520 RepID=A0A0A0J746_9MICO|nr:exodeoxyribonuclease III [Knoellia sinensis]KGN32988.1 exodeoxyribonuclease III [Knoellia sinensis KCTC 19936]